MVLNAYMLVWEISSVRMTRCVCKTNFWTDPDQNEVCVWIVWCKYGHHCIYIHGDRWQTNGFWEVKQPFVFHVVSQWGTNRTSVTFEKGKPKPVQIKQGYMMCGWSWRNKNRNAEQSVISYTVYACDLCLCTQASHTPSELQK